MSTFHSLRSSGAPTFTAPSASLSLSGLDHFAVDGPDLLDVEWYHGPDHYHLPQPIPHPQSHHHPKLHAPSPLSPVLAPFAASAAYAYPSHTAPASNEAFAGQYPAVDLPMNGHAYPPFSHERSSRLDDLSPISPLQPPPYANADAHGGAYQTPYPDSTASSIPSEDPIVVEAEEDKRKRNQAASARFRQKKKQREQHMLEQSRGMLDKNKKLEGEVEGLKRENTFLKKLLVEKIDNMTDDDRALLVKSTDGAVSLKKRVDA